MLGSSRQSLIQRIIEIAQKPHGGGTVETAKQLQSILPPLCKPWVVESAVKFVTSPRYKWQECYIQRSIEGMCAALAQPSTEPDCINSFCQHVSEEPHSRFSSAMSSRCFHHLLPAVAKHKRLHVWGQKLVDEMLTRQLAPSRKVKECLPKLYRSAEDTVDLVRVIERMKQKGLTPSRPLYKKALDLVMSHKRMRDPTENDSILKQVTEGMAADWGKKETERAIYLAALRMTGKMWQVSNIWDIVKTSGIRMDEKSSDIVIEACLRAAAKQKQGKRRVWRAVCCLKDLASMRVPVSVHTFDSILAACSKAGQSIIALDVFKCMTAVYGFAPTRKGYGCLIKSVSCVHSFYNNPILSRRVLHLCSQILGDAVTAYAGSPPPWVYTETAKPLTQLLGVPGYQIMYAATTKGPYSIEDPACSDGSCWDIAAYNSLLEACQITSKDKATLGMYLFGELLNKGLQPDEQTFSLVLSLVHNQHDIHNDHFIHLISCMSILSAGKIETLQEPLLAALCRIYVKEQDGSNIGDGILLAAAARGMVHSAISSTHHYCIEQIDRVCADVSLNCDNQGYHSDGDEAEELQRVGLS